jgi:hypothetical protein
MKFLKYQLLDFLHNPIQSLKWHFLASFLRNFSTVCTHMLSKFLIKSARKLLTFPIKAGYARSLLIMLTLGIGSVYAVVDPAIQDGSRFSSELNERDFIALRDYLKRKREIPLEEKDEHLAISGDVRFEYRHMTETQKGVRLRGPHALDPRRELPISRNDFDSEFNLKFDYILDRSWAVAHVQYDNSSGVDSQDLDCEKDHCGWFGSGNCDSLCVRKAYMGYNVCRNPVFRFDIELGRRGNLYNVFDSRVQFLSRFDGILFKWGGKAAFADDWYIKLAGIVVDERVNHFAYVTELGLLNIGNSGFDFKYSLINWCPYTHSRCLKHKEECKFRGKFFFDPLAFRFHVSQWSLVYHIHPRYTCGIPTYLFGAFVLNHDWKDAKIKKGKHKGEFVRNVNKAWYAGIFMGEVEKEGDWALEIQYQYVEALAVPDKDMSGIGRGNVLNSTFTFNRRGNTNFRGWRVEGLYALTDYINFDGMIEASRAINPRLGGRHTYSKVEIETIYAF